MSEEKKKEGDAKTEGAKKKGLSPMILIVVGAIVGGAGAVFAIPPKTVEKVVEKPKPKALDLLHPDEIQHEFNPRTKAGKGMVRLSFKFRYDTREDLEEQAYEQLKQHWEEAKSVTLLLFRERGMEELQSPPAVKVLEKDLIEALDHTLFPTDEHTKVKYGKVKSIVWVKWLGQ